MHLKGAGRLVVDPTCKAYSKAALLQPMRATEVNTSNAREHGLAQVQLLRRAKYRSQFE